MRTMRKWKKGYPWKNVFPWKKGFPRIFAVMLTAAMLITMPGTASVAATETVETDDTSKTIMEQTADEETEEQEQVDISQYLELQEALDAANVPVPLTIKPSAETSWYYGSGEHSLTMNAQPVVVGTVTYEWCDGDTDLNCAADAYPIPENLDAGNYTYTCKATCDGYTLSHDFTFEIKRSGTEFTGDGVAKAYLIGTEQYTFSVDDPMITVIATPTVTGAAPANAAMAASFTGPAGGQMALFVGDIQVSAPVDAGKNGSYTMNAYTQDVLAAAGEPGTIELIARFIGTENQAGAESKVEITVTAVAKVTTSGAAYYYGTIEDTWSSATANSPAAVTLLGNATVSAPLAVAAGKNITFDGGEYILTCDSHMSIFDVGGGTLTIVGGTITSACVVEINSGTLAVTGGKLEASQLGIMVTGANSTVHLSGGTITGGSHAVSTTDNSVRVSDFLLNYGGTSEPHYAYYQGSTPVTSGLDEKDLPAGTYTVKECNHNAADVAQYQHNDGEQTHTLFCLACGYANAAETCIYQFADNVGTCSLCSSEIEVTVTDTENLVYDNTEKTPGVTVTLDSEELAAENYSVIYDDNINAGVNTASVTVSGTNWRYTQKFTIEKARLTITASDQEILYGQSITTGWGSVTWEGLCDGDALDGYRLTSSAANVSGGTITPSAAVIKRTGGGDVTENYAITYIDGKLTVFYMDPPETILYDNTAKEDHYGRKEVVISAAGYTVSEDQDSGYADSFTIPFPEQTGTVKKTLYFGKDGGISDAVEIVLHFDLTPPTGKVGIGTKWWETLLQTISFGHYTAKEYTITIESNDAGGSGIAETEYAIIEGGAWYTSADELAKAGITWKVYEDGKEPKVPADSECVIYARLTDKAGNVSYIGTDGILLDETPPVVDELSIGTVETRTADFTFTVDEAAYYYYVVLPESADAPEAADILAALKGGTAVAGCAAAGVGEVTEDQITGEKAAVKVTADGLAPGTSYKVYVTAVDKTVDLETGASAGNVAEVAESAGFAMKKLDQAPPILSYQTDSTDENNVKITIKPVDGAQYSFDGGRTWQDANEQDGFSASQTVTLAILMKETAAYNESPAQTVTVDLSKKDGETPPAFTLRYEANGETDYTVTIPPTEGCEYSFDGENWSDDNVQTGVKAGETVTGYKRYKETDESNTGSAVTASETMRDFMVKTPVISPAGGSYSGSVSVTITCDSADAVIYYTTNGSTPTCSSTRYTGAFTVTPTVTVKAIAIKEGFIDSAIATASYTEQSSGGSEGSGGGDSDDGENSSDEGDGGDNGTGLSNDNSRPGTGARSTVPTVHVIPSAADARTDPETAQKDKEPFIKGEEGKTGWDVIRAEEEKAEDGSIINVDMNGAAVVPGDIFDSVRDRDITITFDMGDGIIWSVDGESVTRVAFASPDKAGDIDFSVKTGVNAIPVDLVNSVTGEGYTVQISLAHEGEFGFTAVLSIGLGKENAGYTASLYYYRESAGNLEWIGSDIVTEDGMASFAFTHASDYVIAIDREGEKSGGELSAGAPAGLLGSGNTEDNSGLPQTGQAWRPWWFAVIGAVVILVGIGVFFVAKKKRGDK